MSKPDNQGAAPAAPFAPINGEDYFMLPSGEIGNINDSVVLPGGNLNTSRYAAEVRLIKLALCGVDDTVIDRTFREVVRESVRRYDPDTVQEVFVSLWMDAFNLMQQAKAAGESGAASACGYLHNKLCIAHRDLRGEEHFDLDTAPSTQRPVFRKVDTIRTPRPDDKPSVNLGELLQSIEIERMTKCLRWIADNPGAHPKNVAAVAREGLGVLPHVEAER